MPNPGSISGASGIPANQPRVITIVDESGFSLGSVIAIGNTIVDVVNEGWDLIKNIGNNTQAKIDAVDSERAGSGAAARRAAEPDSGSDFFSSIPVYVWIGLAVVLLMRR